MHLVSSEYVTSHVDFRRIKGANADFKPFQMWFNKIIKSLEFSVRILFTHDYLFEKFAIMTANK